MMVIRECVRRHNRLPQILVTDESVCWSWVKIQYLWYTCAAFDDPQVIGTNVPVKFDPYNVGRAFAYVKGNWVSLTVERSAILGNCSERLLKLASAELRRRRQIGAGGRDLLGKILADFMQSIESNETLLKQRKLDLQNRSVLGLPAESDKQTQTMSQGRTQDHPDTKPAVDLATLEILKELP